jgi:hypothetical protein
MTHIIKKGTIKVPTQPKDYGLQATGLVFKSYDNQIALELHITEQDGKPADLLGANVRLLMNIYEEVDGVVTKDPVPFIASNLVTESYLNGVVKYILPDSLKAYNGTVETFVYVDYPDNSSSDNIGFTFRMEKSKIDKIASGKAEYFIQDFKALLAEVNLQVDEFSANVTELQNEVKTIGNEVKAIENEVKSLTKLQALYSNSLDFGDYDYSGNPNLFVNKLESSDFIKGNHGSLTDDNGILHFTSDGTGDISMLTSANMPSVGSGKTYTLSAKLRFDEGTTGDINKLRLTYRKTPGGSVLLEANNTSMIIDDVGKEITIKGTASVAYEITNLDRFFISVSFSQNGKINGGFKLYDIKIEEGSTATPYQPNLLDAPYYLSKAPLGENIANKNTAFPISSSKYTLYSAKIQEPFVAGTTYTITLEGTKPSTQAFVVYGQAVEDYNYGSMKPVEGLANTWSLTFTASKVSQNFPTLLQILQKPGATVGACTINWLKIEKGDTRTPNIERHRYKGLALLGTTEPTKYEWDYTMTEVDDKVSKTPAEPTSAGENASESTLQTSQVVELLRQLTTVEILKLTPENTTFIAEGSITFKRIGNVISVYANVKIKNDIASGVAVHALTQEWKTVVTHGLIDGKGTDDTVRQMYITADDGVTLKTGTPFKQDEWFIGTGDYITDYIKI